MHDSFTALGGFVPLFNIQLGRNHRRRRGRGPLRDAGVRRAGGLHRRAMVGRTPEYLGKKIQA